MQVFSALYYCVDLFVYKLNFKLKWLNVYGQSIKTYLRNSKNSNKKRQFEFLLPGFVNTFQNKILGLNLKETKTKYICILPYNKMYNKMLGPVSVF